MVRERGALTERVHWSARVGGAARVLLATALAAVLVVGAVLLGCAQALDLSSLREGSSDAGTIDDASEAAEAAIDAPADTGPCPLTMAQACNPKLQCGCAVDENCEVTLPNGTTSCSSVGNTPLWGNCKGFGVCQKGAECVDHACKPFCATTDDCARPGRLCVQVVSSGVAISDLTVCSAGCDLLDPSVVCEPGVTCNPVPWDGAGADHGDCVGGAGTGMGAGACKGNDSTSCSPGYSCVANACAKWCRIGHNEDCTSPTTCTELTVTPRIDKVPYGLCQ